MNVRQIRTALWAVSFLFFGLSAIVVALDLLEVGSPRGVRIEEDAGDPGAQAPDPDRHLHEQAFYEQRFASIWKSRLGEPRVERPRDPGPRRDTPTDPATELKGLLTVKLASGGQAHIAWRIDGKQKEEFFSAGQSVPLPNGQSAQVLEMFIDPADLYKSGTVTFLYKGARIVIPWKQGSGGASLGGGRSQVPADFGKPADYDTPTGDPEGRAGMEHGEYGAQNPDGAYTETESRQIRKDHWRIGASEWRDIFENFESHAASVNPTAVLDPASGAILGLKLGDVPSDSLAWQRGFRTGDIVQRVNGEPVQGLDQLQEQMQKNAQSTQAVIEVDRNGRRVTMIFELAQ